MPIRFGHRNAPSVMSRQIEPSRVTQSVENMAKYKIIAEDGHITAEIDDEIMADNKVTADEAELVNNDIYVPP